MPWKHGLDGTELEHFRVDEGRLGCRFLNSEQPSVVMAMFVTSSLLDIQVGVAWSETSEAVLTFAPA